MVLKSRLQAAKWEDCKEGMDYLNRGQKTDARGSVLWHKGLLSLTVLSAFTAFFIKMNAIYNPKIKVSWLNMGVLTLMTSSLIHHGNLPMVLLKNYDMGGGENTDDDLMVLCELPQNP